MNFKSKNFPLSLLRLRAIFSILLLLVIIGELFRFFTLRSTHSLIEEVLWENFSSFSQSVAGFTAPSLARGDMPELQQYLDIAFKKQDMLFVVVRNLDQEVVAQAGSLAKYTPFEIHENIFESVSTRVQEIGIEPHGLFHLSGHTFLITSFLVHDGRDVGTLQMAVNSASANQRMANISFWGLLIGIAVVALGVALLIFVNRRIKSNILRLIQFTRGMATGDFSQRVEINTGDEIEHLGETVNMMAEAVKKNKTQLGRLVELRTSELENEKNKLQLILDNVPSAFLMLDKELRVESVSSQFESVLNKTRNDVLGKKYALADILYQTRTLSPSQKAIETGEIQSGDAHIVDPSGEDKFLEHMAIPIHHNGKSGQVLEIVSDITARKRFEAQLVRTEKLSATGEMAAIIAHEMRNSLSSVNLILQCMTDKENRDQEEGESIEVAIQAVNRMETIVSQLLEFARPSQLNYQQMSINEAIDQSLLFCKYQLQRKQIVLKKNLAADLPLLELDVEIIRQVLINLILNAKDAVDSKGSLSIEAVSSTLKTRLYDNYEHKSVTLKAGQGVVELRVTDNGCGILSENFERVFDPFYTSKTNGTGLGLTMARRAIAEHGGIILVESEVGHGSTFTIVLPIAQEKS